MIGKQRYTKEIKDELKIALETLFEKNCPKGRYQLYDFCEKNNFDHFVDGYIGYAYLEHTIFQIIVSKSDDYFCRVYFHER